MEKLWNIFLIIFSAILSFALIYFELDKKRGLKRLLNKSIIFFRGSETFEVGVSFTYREGSSSENYYDSIKSKMEDLISNMKLEKNIRIQELPLKFKNKTKVIKYSNKNDISLIIWGSITGDGEKEQGQQVHDVVVNFYSPYGKQYSENKNYSIIECNSKKDLKIISKNLTHISTFILAKILFEKRDVRRAKELYESLYKQENIDFVFYKEIENNLLNCLHNLIENAPYDKKNIKYYKELCEKYLEIRPTNKFALTNISVFEFQLENYERSAEYVEETINFYPEFTSTIINAGFTRLHQNRIDEALFYYKKLITTENNDSFNSIQVITFLQDEYKKTKKTILLYVQGIVHIKFTSDSNLGKECLEEYIKKENNNDYKKFKDHAFSVLNKIKN